MYGGSGISHDGRKPRRVVAVLAQLLRWENVVFYFPQDDGIEVVRVLSGMRDSDAFF